MTWEFRIKWPELHTPVFAMKHGYMVYSPQAPIQTLGFDHIECDIYKFLF